VKTLKITVVAAALVASTALALPGELVVLSAKEARADEAAAFYYLGTCGAGYLYNGSSAAVARVAPCRVLDGDAQFKDYYIVWAPAWVKITPEDFKDLGAAARLSEYEILVGLERGLGPGALRAVERRIELIKLEPVTPVEWRYDGEPPPARKSRAIEAAVNSITEQEYAGYIKRLQDFKTRCTDTPGCDAARDYIRDFFATQGLEASLFKFDCMGFHEACYPDPAGRVYVKTAHGTIKRSKDNGQTWDTVWPEGTNCMPSVFWYDRDTGFVGGYNNRIAKTIDGGDTWETIEFASGYPEYQYRAFAAYFATPQIGWLGGEYSRKGEPLRGFVLKTTDGGRTWISQTIPEDFRTYAMGFFGADYGWAGGRTWVGRLFYTANGGESWQECSVPVGVERVEDIAAVGPTEAWAAVGSNNLLHTTDGLTWSWVNTGAAGELYRVEFPDNQHGYAGGYELMATDDGGATWRPIRGLPQGVCYALSFADRNHGVVGERYAKYLYRTDDGCTSFVSIIDTMDVAAENVVGERRGNAKPEEIVVIGGHFDSASDMVPSLAPGAEDNASGTACAMAAARAFRDLRFKRTVRYVAFGAEESGLIGSEAYANHCAAEGEKIVAVLNADMVCYDEDGGARDDFVAGSGDNGRWMFAYLTAVGGLYGQKIIYEDLGAGVSDDRSFERAGYAAMGAEEGGIGAGMGFDYPYAHTTEDTLDKLHPALGVRFVRDYAAMFAHLAGFDDTGIEEPRPGVAAVPFARPFAVYPNPYCYATAAGGVNFVGIKAPATVEIYDLAGRRVAREEVAAGRDACVWRPATPEGGTLAPGVYLYRLDGQEQEKAGKIVIAR